MDNVFEILMIPAQWSYESMEAWYPGTVWNPAGSNIAILFRLGRQQRTHHLRGNRRLLLLRAFSHLRTTPKRTPPSHRHRAPRSPTRLHHAHRRLASPRKRSKRHAPKTLPIQHPRGVAAVHKRQIRDSDATVDICRVNF